MKKNHVRKFILADLTAYPRRFLSDYFVCENCDFAGYFKILGNTKTCPECGGTMHRK